MISLNFFPSLPIVTKTQKVTPRQSPIPLQRLLSTHVCFILPLSPWRLFTVDERWSVDHHPSLSPSHFPFSGFSLTCFAITRGTRPESSPPPLNPRDRTLLRGPLENVNLAPSPFLQRTGIRYLFHIASHRGNQDFRSSPP